MRGGLRDILWWVSHFFLFFFLLFVFVCFLFNKNKTTQSWPQIISLKKKNQLKLPILSATLWQYHLILWSFPLTSTLLVSSVLGEQCNGEHKGSIWPAMNQKIELIVVGQCSMMSEMSWGLRLCVHRHSPWVWKGSVLFGGYKRELCSGIGMAR